MTRRRYSSLLAMLASVSLAVLGGCASDGSSTATPLGGSEPAALERSAASSETVASIAIALSSAAPAACKAATVQLTVTAKDANGATIASPDVYSNPITLSLTSPGRTTTLSTKRVASPATAVTLAYDGKSPSASTVSATASGVPTTAVSPLLFAATPAVCAEYAIPTASSGPRGIVAGSDGYLYFTEYAGRKFARIASTTLSSPGTIDEYASFASPGPALTPAPVDAAFDANGALWITDVANQGVDEYVASSNTLVVHPGPSPTPAPSAAATPVPVEDPAGIASGSDGRLWYAESASNAIVAVTTAGVSTRYAVPTFDSEPTGITAGRSGALWFTEYGANKIASITTSGAITETATSANSEPNGIAEGSGGDMYAAEFGTGKIAVLGAGRSLTEVATPTLGSGPLGVTEASDGNVYFTEALASRIGIITPAGKITEVPLPKAKSFPYAIALGPDKNVWFTEQLGNRIGYLGY